MEPSVQKEKKLRIGCLHGYGTNGKFLKRQMRSFIRQFGKDFEFVFLDGPFQAPKQFVLDEKVLKLIDGQTKAWTPPLSFRNENKQYMRKTISEGINALENGSDHYDGLLGFSQGAVMTHLITRLHLEKKISTPVLKGLKFVIMTCGNSLKWDGFDLTKPLDFPSIHLISPADFLFPKSIFTVAQFINPLTIYHEAGHSFPRLGRQSLNKIRKYIKGANYEDLKSQQAKL